MALGYAVQGQCVETLQQALTAYCSTFPQNFNNNSNSVYTTSCREVNANNTITIVKQTNSATPAITTPTPEFMRCTIQENTNNADLSTSSVFFATAFISVVTLFLFTKVIGTVLKSIDNWAK